MLHKCTCNSSQFHFCCKVVRIQSMYTIYVHRGTSPSSPLVRSLFIGAIVANDYYDRVQRKYEWFAESLLPRKRDDGVLTTIVRGCPFSLSHHDISLPARINNHTTTRDDWILLANEYISDNIAWWHLSHLKIMIHIINYNGWLLHDGLTLHFFL